MPWPMIHFAIAFRLNSDRPSPALLLGSVAPDAVLVRDNDPEGKIRSHLGKDVTTDDLLAFMREHITPGKADDDRKQFLLGYVAHIFADLEWLAFKRKLSGADRTLRERLWQEENQFDFDLYRKAVWKEQLMKAVHDSPLYVVDGLYEADELDRWRKRLFHWLDHAENEPNIRNAYITEDRVEAFIRDVSESFKNQFLDSASKDKEEQA